MAYTQVKVSWEPEIIGVTNGIYQFEIEAKQFKKSKDYESFILSFAKEETIREYLGSQKPILEAKLLKKAKATDFMGYSEHLRGIPFAVSKGALEVLKQFELGEHYTIEVKFTNSVVDNYFLVWFPFTEVDKIDFRESVLYSRGKYGSRTEPKQYHKINSYDDYLAFFNKYRFNLFFERIILNKSEVICDLVQMRVGGVYVSERLKSALVDSDMKGLEFLNKVVFDFA